MTLHTLANWESTRFTLHQSAQVLGVFRKLNAPPQPIYLHLPLNIVPQGVSTGPLTFGGELILDFAALTVRYLRDGQEAAAFPLAGHNQVSLLAGVQDKLSHITGQKLAPQSLSDQTAFAPDKQTAADYADTLYSLYTITARFRARILGRLSPIILWPHNFDFSFLLFADEFNDDKLHAAFGFEPHSPGFDRPYLYAYVRPTPAGITDNPLPAPARWHTEGWTGAVVDYDALVGQSETAVEAIWYGIYQAVKESVVR